ncbi:tyrosine-type recombinase/integrase [Streptosporangium lutulentum]|uniref:Site-specific recombinase XerD n=1 Tax=Streptosporangium lutulentum TaxID=1461250 RepID=A0ABT9QKU3_9ACTN|nr:site-specific integrase [Streptosporangium lutulentum]MDP9847376.1 site-specific recombinase XerD [Streptosporangium lutulentum]
MGRLVATGDPWEPFQLLDRGGAVVEPVAAFLRELQAQDLSESTLRSYGNDLLLWWRWLAAVEVPWNQVTPAEGRDFARWMQIADKPTRTHWRHRDGSPDGADRRGRGSATSRAGEVNPQTGKAQPGTKFAPSSRAHAETVLRRFYDFQLEAGTGPIVNPFPLDRLRRAGRANAHHNPMEPFRRERVGRYRPKLPARIPKRVPDDQFNKIFAGLKYHRDRALVAFWVSTGARAEELLDSFQDDVDPGEQVISVTRKGSRATQLLPASPDAFVWLRLYQEEIWRKGAARGRRQPLWVTLRRPFRPLTYPAARAMFARAQELLGSNWTIHDLRHSAAWRMSQDPNMPISDVQWILGHASLSTTQLYITPSQDEVIAHALAHHDRRRQQKPVSVTPPAVSYNPRSLDILFGRDT